MTDLLLDTHIFIWLLIGNQKLENKNLALIDSCLESKSKLCLSAISIWEIAMLEKKKRILFSSPITKWIEEAIKQSAIQIIDLSIEIMIDSCNLPGEFHSDPADRMIVATSRIHKIPLITQDHRILDYISSGFVPSC